MVGTSETWRVTKRGVSITYLLKTDLPGIKNNTLTTYAMHKQSNKLRLKELGYGEVVISQLLHGFGDNAKVS